VPDTAATTIQTGMKAHSASYSVGPTDFLPA